jgi:Ca2+-binding EF-hand superfamily protein
VRNREEEDLIKTLYSQVKELKTKNTKLTKDNEKLTEQYERKKREVSILSKGKKMSATGTAATARRASPDHQRPSSGSSLRAPKSSALTESRDVDVKAASARRSQDAQAAHSSSRPGAGVGAAGGGPSASASMAFRDEGLLQITQQLQNRLNNTEEMLIRAKEENATLRQRLAANPHKENASGGNAAYAPSGASTDAQTRDLTVRLQILQTQYDHLASKSSSHKGTSLKAEDELESYAQKVRDLRRALEDLRYEKELSDIKAGRVKEQEETISELRLGNRNLEDKISRLCQTPFIGEAFGNQEAQYRCEDVTQERNDLQTKIDHLQEAVRTHYSALVTLRQQAAKLREEKEEAEKVAESMRNQQQELRNGHSLLQDKLKMYSGEDGVSIEDLERALTVVKRRGEAGAGRLDFLEDPDALSDGDGHRIGPDHASYAPLLKRKAQELQVLNLNLTREVERLESMLKLQAGINRDLHKELEQLVAHRDKDKAEVLKRAESFEELALRRQEKIFALESQIRQYIYGMVKRSKGKDGKDAPPGLGRALDLASSADFAGDSTAEQALLSDLIEDAGGEIQPDDNLLEVWIKGCTVRDNALSPGCSTFVVTDFFDYESQSTGLVSGNHPKFDFATTFKITVDDFLLRHLATDVISFELNMACQGDFTMLARCTAPLSALLRSKPVVRLVNHPMVSVKTSEVIANITVEIRLALPLSELYRLFLERHPQERRLIEELSNKRILENNNLVERSRLLGGDALTQGESSVPAAKEDESRMFNELEVTIVAADGLPTSSDGKAPSPYVLFQLLGHPDKFTNIVESSSSPVFNERFYFPMITNDATTRLLRRSQLLLSVLDMREEELYDGTGANKAEELNGILGAASVSLAALSDGAAVSDFFTIRGGDNQSIGRLRVTLKWKNPFRRPRELGPRALSDVEIETLVAGFAAGMGNEGGVDYRAFVRFVDPPAAVGSAIQRLRQYAQRLSDKEGLSPSDIFSTVLDRGGKDSSSSGVREDSFVAAMIGLEVDLLPAEYSQLFRFADIESTGSINVDQLIAVLNLDEQAGIPETLQDKLRTRVRDLESRDVSALKLFERADNWGMKGVVTRLEFKTVLCQMGFQLPDDPSGPLLDMRARREEAAADGDRDGDRAGAGDRGADARHSLDDGDELLPSGGRRTDRGSAPADSGGPSLSSEAQQQRDIFQQKLNDIQARTREAAKHPPERREPVAIASNAPSAVATEAAGVNLLDRGSVEAREHRAGVHASHASAPAPDSAAVSHSAVKVQAVYRGHSARKQTSGAEQGRGGVGDSSPTATRPPLNARGRESVRGSDGGPAGISPGPAPLSLSLAEDMLRACLRDMQQTSGPVSLIGSFVTLDGKRRGFVNRQQFAMALRQHKNLALAPEALRAFMDFFDSSQTGADIDYNAFVVFASYKPLDPLPASKLVNAMAITKESMDVFRSLDANGTGFLKRQEMLRGLAEAGYGHFSQSQSQAVMALFETDVEGHVNFGNLVEYCMSSPMGQTYAELEHSLRSIVGAKGQDDLPRWFRKIDSAATGFIDARALAVFLDQFDVHPPKAAVSALCRAMALSSGGSRSGEVGVQEFSAWARKSLQAGPGPGPGPADRLGALAFSHLSLAELQRKAAAYLLAMALHRDGSLNDVSQSFQVYDWKKPSGGVIGRPEFCKAALRAGFLFTPSELDILTAEFSSPHGGVLFRKFLAWATPMAPAKQAPAGEQRESVAAAGGIARLLQKGLRKGIDLLSVFGRYDTTGVGRISCDEFCAALSDLGWSAVSKKEAMDFADRYRAAAGDLVMYRRIVTELLRQIDDDADPAAGRAGAHGMGDITELIAAKLAKDGVDIHRLRDLFEYYDRKNIGHVRIDDLAIVFEEAKVPLRRYELDAVTERFSGRRSAGGDYEGYIQYPVLVNALQLKVGADAFGRAGPGTGTRASAARQSGLSSQDLDAKIAGTLETAVMLGKDFRSLFDAQDSKFSGAVSVPAFKSIWIDELNADLGEAELDALCGRYRDRDDPRLVSHVRLLRDLHPRLQAGGSWADSAAEADASALDIAETLRQKVRRRYDYSTPGELRSPFQHFAGGNGESVTLEDFSIGLRKLGIRVASDQEKAVFDCINSDNGRGFQYAHFATFVSDPLFADVVWKLRRLMARNHVSSEEVVETVTAADTNASGLITARQFSKAMRSCRVELSDADVSRLLLRFDSEGNQRFDVDEFIFFLKGKSGRAGGREPVRDEAAGGPATAESAESRAMGALRRGVQKKLDAGYTAAEVFALFDPADRRCVDLSALQEGAREVAVAVSRVEARAVLRRMSVLSGGAVDRGSFFAALEIDAGHHSRRRGDGTQRPDEYERDRDRDRDPRDRDRAGSRAERGGSGSGSPRASRDRAPSSDAGKGKELLSSLKTELLSKNAGGRGAVAKDLLRILDGADADSDGKVSSIEFVRAVGTLNTQHTRRELGQLFDHCSADRAGRDRAGSTGRDRDRDRDRLDSALLSTSAFIEMLFDAEDFRGASSHRDGRRGSRSRSPEGARGRGGGAAEGEDMLRAAQGVFTKRPALMDALLAQLLVAKEKGATLRDFVLACEDVDTDRRGFVRKSDFAKALHRGALNMKPDTERDLLDSLDDAFSAASRGSSSSSSRSVSKGLHYQSFVACIEKELTAEDEADEVLAKLRRNIARAVKDGQEIEEIFNRMDRDRSGRISVDEFEDGLRKIGISVSREESKRIASKFSSLGGTINYRDFVKAFLPHGGGTADVDFIEAMIKRIRNTLMDRMGSHAMGKRQMEKVFEEIDVNRDGSLTIREMKDAMGQLKVSHLVS